MDPLGGRVQMNIPRVTSYLDLPVRGKRSLRKSEPTQNTIAKIHRNGPFGPPNRCHFKGITQTKINPDGLPNHNCPVSREFCRQRPVTPPKKYVLAGENKTILPIIRNGGRRTHALNSGFAIFHALNLCTDNVQQKEIEPCEFR
ncbi:MAG: hypothetical protein CBE00_01625 [Planctomycetaceae bacterium TMED240]|nr:MAG: hypothetical protein CBE00_01625 [Planctomycetaceae bacterium TMED240]